MKKMSRIMALALALVLLCGILPVSALAQQEKMLVRYVTPGNYPNDYERVVAAINAKLEADGLPLEFQMIKIPWDVWEQKTNLMIATQEEFELLHVMEGNTDFDVYYNRGATQAISDEMIQQYAPLLWESMRKEVWDAARVDGKIVTLPDFWYNEFAIGATKYNFRSDLYEKYGVDLPTGYGDLIPQMKKLQDAIYADTGEKYYVLFYHDMPCPPLTDFTSPDYPYVVANGSAFAKLNNDGTLESWLESEECKAGCDFMHEMYDMGLIHPDILTMPRETFLNNYVNTYKGLWFAAYIDGLLDEIPDAKQVAIDLDQDPTNNDDLVVTTLFRNSNAIPATCTNPEAALMFLNWLTIRENGQLLAYGEEGKDWVSLGGNYYEPTNENGYFFDYWMFLNHQYRLYTASTPEENVYTKDATGESLIFHASAGFSFDATPVLTEWTNLDAAYNELVWPMLLGVVAYDDVIEDTMAALRGLGLDKYLEEYARQYAEHCAK